MMLQRRKAFTLLEMIVAITLTGAVTLAVITWVSSLTTITTATIGAGAAEREAAAFDTRFRLDAGNAAACINSGRRTTITSISQSNVSFVIADTAGNRARLAHWNLVPGDPLTGADGATTAGKRWNRSVANPDPSTPDSDCQWASPEPGMRETVATRVRDNAKIRAYDHNNNEIPLPVGDSLDPAWDCLNPSTATQCAQIRRISVHNIHVAGNGTPVHHRSDVVLPAHHF